jgi:hypothetical protein
MVRAAFVAAALSSSVVFQGPSTPVYDATFTLGEKEIYKGTATFGVDGKGVVRGKMQLAQPLAVLAQLGGTVKDGVWTIEYSYTIPERKCTGLVKGTGQVPADRKAISGTVVISGDCSPTPQSATFAFTRRVSKSKLGSFR